MNNGAATDPTILWIFLILWVGAWAFVVLLSILIYVLVDAAVRGLLLLVALATCGCSWVANPLVRLVAERTTTAKRSPRQR